MTSLGHRRRGWRGGWRGGWGPGWVNTFVVEDPRVREEAMQEKQEAKRDTRLLKGGVVLAIALAAFAAGRAGRPGRASR